MLELSNFGCMTTSAIQFESRDKKIFGDVMDRNDDVIKVFSKHHHFKRA